MSAVEAMEAEGDALAEAVLAASEAVTDALLAGRDTAAARARMQRAKAAFDAHQAKAVQAREQVAARRSAEIAERGRALADEAMARLRAALDAIPIPKIGADTMPAIATIMIPEADQAELQRAAAHLARAARDLEDAEADAREAREEEEKLQGRIAELDARRAAIGARRAAGTMRPGDAGEIELIALDREGLTAMLGDAAAKASAAREAAEQRRRVADMARAGVAQIEARARRDHFASQAGALTDALLTTIAAMNEASKAVGDRVPAWAAPEALRARMRELEFRVLR